MKNLIFLDLRLQNKMSLRFIFKAVGIAVSLTLSTVMFMYLVAFIIQEVNGTDPQTQCFPDETSDCTCHKADFACAINRSTVLHPENCWWIGLVITIFMALGIYFNISMIKQLYGRQASHIIHV